MKPKHRVTLVIAFDMPEDTDPVDFVRIAGTATIGSPNTTGKEVQFLYESRPKDFSKADDSERQGAFTITPGYMDLIHLEEEYAR